MKKQLFLIQARLGSTRLPNKVLKKIDGNNTLLDIVYKRVNMSKYANKENVFVLTSNSPKDDKLANYLKLNNINYFRGNENNVYDRFFSFISENIKSEDFDFIVRICCDNPFIEPKFIDNLIDIKNNNFDYISYFDKKNNRPAILTHYGFFVELIKLETFVNSYYSINNKKYEEHVTPIFYEKNRYKKEYLAIPEILYNKEYRFTIDTQIDFNNARNILLEIDNLNFNYKQILQIVDSNIEIVNNMKKQINKNFK